MKHTLSNTFRTMISSLGANPRADWHFALGCFAIVLLIGIIANALFYVSILQTTDARENAIAPEPVRLDRDLLRKTAENIRENAREHIPSEVLRDPSI